MHGWREGKRERAEAVGDSGTSNMLSLCKTDRKAAIRELKSCSREEGAGRVVEMMWTQCQGRETKPSSRRGGEVILRNRCTLKRHQLKRRQGVQMSWIRGVFQVCRPNCRLLDEDSRERKFKRPTLLKYLPLPYYNYLDKGFCFYFHSALYLHFLLFKHTAT